MVKARSYLVDVIQDGAYRIVKLPKGLRVDAKKLCITKVAGNAGFILKLQEKKYGIKNLW